MLRKFPGILECACRFNNPYDPLLALAEDDSAADLGQQVAVKASTDSARRLALSYDLIQGKALSDTHTLSATVSLSHDQADPLYQSVGASVAADIEQNTADLSVQIGDLSVQGQVSQSENNLDNLSTVLKTRTRQQALSVFAPMGSIFGQSDTGRSWWPELAYSFARVHQFAANAPDPELSGFDDPAFLPDDISIQHSLDLGWNLDSWQFGVQFGYSKQDDRRNTQQQLDTNNMNYGLRAGWQATDRLRLDIDLGRDRNVDKAQALTSYFDQSGISLDWQLWEGLNVSGNYSYSRGHDELGSSETVDTSAFLQISKIFRYPLPAGNCPGRCFSVTQTRHRTTGSEPSVSPVAEVTGLSIPASASVFFKLFIFETFQMH